MADVTFFLTVDESGDWAVGATPEDSVEKFVDEIGGYQQRRTVELKISVDFPPVQTVEVCFYNV